MPVDGRSNSSRLAVVVTVSPIKARFFAFIDEHVDLIPERKEAKWTKDCNGKKTAARIFLLENPNVAISASTMRRWIGKWASLKGVRLCRRKKDHNVCPTCAHLSHRLDQSLRELKYAKIEVQSNANENPQREERAQHYVDEFRAQLSSHLMRAKSLRQHVKLEAFRKVAENYSQQNLLQVSIECLIRIGPTSLDYSSSHVVPPSAIDGVIRIHADAKTNPNFPSSFLQVCGTPLAKNMHYIMGFYDYQTGICLQFLSETFVGPKNAATFASLLFEYIRINGRGIS